MGTEGAADSVLLARILAGDERSLGIVYDQNSPLVFGIARRVTRDEQLARDITQEVFAYLWEMPDRVDLSRGTLRAYLVMLAHRRAVDEVRRNERRTHAELMERAAAVTELLDGPEDEVVDAAADSWMRQRLRRVLNQLPDEQRTAIRLAYYEGLTYKQVATALGIPEGTAKSRLRLALHRLRNLLDTDIEAVT